MTDRDDFSEAFEVEEGVSLDELARAFSETLRDEDPAPASNPPAPVFVDDEASDDLPEPEGPDDAEIDAVLEAAERLEAAARRAVDRRGRDDQDEDDDPAFEDADEDDACPVGPRTILEAMLFMGTPDNSPLLAARAAELMRGVEEREIPELVAELNERYQAEGRPYTIVSEAGGYRMVLRPEQDVVRGKFYGRVREARLSPAAIETLAIVAYRQPIAGDEVNRIRSAPSGHLLTQLVRRMLLRLDREVDGAPGPHYRTTDRFLELFGLETVNDLPQLEELE